MNPVRIGIAGLGMGANHAGNILSGKVRGLELVAVADLDRARRQQFAGLAQFASASQMIASGLIDAILIATPHFDHPVTGREALKAGLHVMVEKPLAVHKADAHKLLAIRPRKGQVFATMLNQRTDGYYRRIRELVRTGELGRLRRINWIITTWFRTDVYYRSSAWRATWAGEGGGVLLNQCVHNLDLFQWMFGQPKRVRAFCGFGRYRKVEVEDDVTAYLEQPDGASAVFVTSVGEAPGTNRLEVTGERGKLVYENDRIVFYRNDVEMTRFARQSPKPFARPAAAPVEITVDGHGGQHVEVLQNFVDAIREQKPLIAPAVDGLASVELANAMLLSTWTDKTVDLPLNAATYHRQLKQRMATSRLRRRTRRPLDVPKVDMAKSFGR